MNELCVTVEADRRHETSTDSLAHPRTAPVNHMGAHISTISGCLVRSACGIRFDRFLLEGGREVCVLSDTTTLHSSLE